jgi:putative transposase
MPFVTEEVEEAVYRCIQGEVQEFGCDVLAIGGMPDHVHLVIAFTSLHSFGKFVQQVKGVSSRFAKDLPATNGIFSWQEGYALFTLSPNHVEKAVAYVRNQKRHHTRNKVWSEWEETDEEVPDSMVTEDNLPPRIAIRFFRPEDGWRSLRARTFMFSKLCPRTPARPRIPTYPRKTACPCPQHHWRDT